MGAIGDAQQQYTQAQLMAQQQQIAEQNAAQQQQLQNMLAAQGLGGNYLGQRSEYVDPNAGTKQVIGLMAALSGFA